jgi:hypothetical protein
VDERTLPLLLLKAAEAGEMREDLDEVIEPMEGFVFVDEELPLSVPDV